MFRSTLFYLTLITALLSMTGVAGGASQSGVTATGGDASISVSWTNTCRVCQWRVCTKQGNGSWTVGATLSNARLSYTVTGLKNSLEYVVDMEAKRAGRWVTRALLNVMTTPKIPVGTWTSQIIAARMTFASYLAAGPDEIAVAGLDATSALNPSVWRCSPLTFSTCTKVTGSLTGVNAPTALQYDANGNLYAMFTKSVAVPDNPTQTDIKKLSRGANDWQDFKSFGGVSLSLDVTDAGILTGSSYLSCTLGGTCRRFTYGAVDFYNHNGAVIKSNINFDSSTLTGVANDGLGKQFVGGLDYPTNPNSQAFSSVWIWDMTAPSGHNFTKIIMPTVVVSITDMISNGNGVVYIAGVDIMNKGKVWKYQNGTVTDTGLAAFQVAALDFSSNGYFVAGGQDNVNYNGQVWYYDPSTGLWTSLGIPNAFQIVNVSVYNPTNQIYAVGMDNLNQSMIWVYK